MKKDSEFCDHKSKKSYPYIIKGLLLIAMFISLGSFAYAKFAHKPDTQPEQTPIQINGGSEIIKEDTTTLLSDTQTSTVPLYDNGTSNTSTDSATHTQGTQSTNSYENLSNKNTSKPYQYTATPADKYDEWKIKQAEEEAQQAAEERKKHDEACRPILVTRQQLLAPLNAQFDEITRQMNEFESETNARTDINSAQKDRVLAAGLLPFYDQTLEVSQQIEEVNTAYPSCLLYNY